MTLQGVANNAKAFAQSIVGQNPKNQGNKEDGTPPSPPPQLPKGVPHDYSGQSPRLQDKLATMIPKELQDSTLKLLDEGKTDPNAQEEIRDLVMDNTSSVFTLWIPKILMQVQLGHSPFNYMSKARKDDPYHQHTIIFMGDRTNRGDPIPYAMPPEKAKARGTWREVKWDDKVDAQATFFEDEKNLNKLYSPTRRDPKGGGCPTN